MSSQDVGTLIINLQAQVARLEKDMQRGADSVKKGADQIESAARFARNALLGLAAVLGVNQFQTLVQNSFQAVDAIAKVSDRLGIASEKMAGLQHASDLAGVSNETLNTGLRTMVKNVADAAQGLGEATRAFTTLNLSARDLAALSPDQQLNKLLDALAGVENVTLRNATAAQIFGSRATEMLNLIADGTDGIRKATEDAEAWGKALNRVDSAKIEMANDAVTRAKAAFDGIINTIAVQLAPIITGIANSFADGAKEARGFKDEVVSGFEVITTVVAYSANVIQGLRVVWVGVKLVAAEAINAIIQALYQLDRAFVGVVNSVSGSWVGKKMGLPLLEYSQLLDDVSTVSTHRVREIRAEFDALVMQEMPADKVLAWFAKVKQESQKAAEQIARDRASMNRGGSGDAFGDQFFEAEDKRRATELAKFMENQAREEAALDASLLSQLEREDLHYQQRMEQADRWRSAHLIGDERLAELQTKLTEDHARKRQAIEQQTGNTIRSMHAGVWQGIAGLVQAFAGKSKTAAIAVIAINKGLAIAQTIQSTAAAVMRAYADLGPVAGSAAAADIALLGKVQVGIIAASGLAEAANVPSGGATLGTPGNPMLTTGGSPPPFAQPAAGGDVHVTIINNGTMLGEAQEWIEQVAIPGIVTAVTDKDMTILPTSSRNALDLATT